MRKSIFLHKTCWDVDLSFFYDCLIFSIPRAPSRSNHYVDKVGGYHESLICILNSPMLSPESKRVYFCPSVATLRAQSPPPIGQSDFIHIYTYAHICPSVFEHISFISEIVTHCKRPPISCVGVGRNRWERLGIGGIGWRSKFGLTSMSVRFVPSNEM